MTLLRRHLLCAAALAAAATVAGPWPARAQAQAFDHGHVAWTALLKAHVVLLRSGQASQVRYAALASRRGELNDYLDSLAAVSRERFANFSKAEQQAMLINAYNAHTVDLILSSYPRLKSIKDLGGVFSSPWKGKFIALLGEKLSLDDIEHGLLRKRGVYDDPRLHFAVNCASVGCPMLREEAYQAERIDAQLDEQALRFMADRTRNRWNAQRGRLELSKVFDWYGEDFRLGHRGIASLPAFAARFAEQLADAPADRERIRSEKADISFLDYDWNLNEARNELR